ncbi:hypothetical protein MA20_00830 [Bradyrhizobium japonicum]|uniref:Uncharacterized protein n=1 Tax=Bradyrhizobium japonicum TaxID=375 RepID=A0A0A3Z609_BRAJP|nr:hypothetical protein [Bradyrhizobium japonicum]KGT81328.1 hypothetical protein MA20_00830 [Bradyrhizobium japonicum]MCS3893669.1 hypothetical protein [Bradyrhizobium japonicum USDA 38]MCS3946183.1 hypothetical protein [Bradyrhizobium japonicum]MCW2221494.1 hypothetical protein [Bradyrhizobium japonicum]MCW2346106.1 hypothetical protein [Bradyrhizobium japonicum]
MRQSIEGPHRLLRAWQLALLRFAVTREDCDRLNVAALAGELDRLGRRNADCSCHFFRRSSSRLCAAIDGQREDAEAVLGRFCEQIDEARLRLAFAAALGIAASRPAPTELRRKRSPDLFRGLPSRRTASL